MTYRMGHL